MPSILGANTLSSGYDVANSCRFNDGSSDHMLIAPSSAGNKQTWTWSAWVKRGVLGTRQVLFSGYDQAAGLGESIEFTSGDLLEYDLDIAGTDFTVTSSMVFRDVSAWYHILFIKDVTESTETNRIKVYVNGVQIALVENANGYPAENATNGLINAAGNYEHHVGCLVPNSSFFDGYMCEVVFIDGTAQTNTDFGEFDSDSGIWKPIDVSGLTFGTNGFYFEFKGSGTSANSSGLGADTSGNDHHFTVTNLTAVDQTTDTCTNNFMTLNPLITLTSRTDNQVYSEGNTVVIPNSTDNYGTAFGTFGATRGKWYWEAKIIWNGTENNANYPRTIGFMRDDYAFNQSTLGQNADNSWGVGFADLDTDGWGLDHNGSFSAITGATTLANNKMVMFALDLDNGKFYMGYDGTFFTSGDPTSGATGTGAIATLDATDLSFNIIPALTNATNVTYYQMNFGNPAYAIASSNADGDGFGNFEFAVPSGYFSWCSKNLAEYG